MARERKSRRRSHQAHRADDSLGLNILFEPDSDADTVVDIVFVHGLRGKGIRTWTKDGVLWPRDLLARDVRGARIMSWSYDADIIKFFGIGPTGQGTIGDHAKALNRDLAGERMGFYQRPIIFVAHSLGGLVVKYALFLSKETPTHRDPGVAAIKLSTQGILFAGTPHRGSDKAKWLATTTKFLSYLQRDRSPFLVEALERGSQVLELLQDCFMGILEDFAVYSLFEEMPYPRIGKIVEKDLALIGWHEREVPIHANHSGMVKFDSVDDQNYKRFRNCIQEVIRDRIDGDGDIISAPHRALQRTCTCSTGQKTLVTEDQIHDLDSELQGPTAPRRNKSARRASVATLERSDSEKSSSKITDNSDSSISSQEEAASMIRKAGKLYMHHHDRNEPQTLIKTHNVFQNALSILNELPYPDPAGMVRTLHLIVNVCIEMSYNRGLTSNERLLHLENARSYSREALKYAFRSPLTEHVALVKLYHGILSGREVEVLAKTMTALEVCRRKKEAMEEISRALKDLSESSSLDAVRHYAWAEAWQIKFSKSSKAVTS